MAYIGPEIYKARRERLRSQLFTKNLDCLIICNPANRFYLSGFELHDGQCDESSGFLAITSSGTDWLATDSRYALAAKKLWPQNNIFIYKSDQKNEFAAFIARLGSIIGVDSDNFKPPAVSNHAFQPAFIKTFGLVEKMRAIKEPCEITALEKSFALNHKVIAWLNDNLAKLPGKSEIALAWKIEKCFRENGASELAFATIVAGGSHAASPHAQPREQEIMANAPLLVDLGCRVDNYCSDQTRTWFLAKQADDRFNKTMQLVRDAQQAALDVMKPGVACAAVYDAAYAVFAKSNVNKYFTHGLGHGVGLQTHEKPTLSPTSRDVLEAGMVVTVEPGLYYPDWGGIRWENTVVIEAAGPRLL